MTNLKLEISTDGVTYYEADVFPAQQLEYDVDFFDTLDVGKVKLPFYTTLSIPLTTLNQSATRFNYNPFTSTAGDFPIHIPNTPNTCLLYTSPSPRDGLLSRMPSSA